jgi:hypothetical protein
VTRIARLGRLSGIAVIVATAFAACGSATPSPSAATSPSPSQLTPGSLGPPASLAPGATPLVRIDPGLLAVLPQTVGGQSVLESSEGDADASTNASLALVAQSAVGALAIDPGPGDFVLALVVRLKPGALDDAGFRNWRDNFDAGACAATGIAGHAESQIGGRTVYVATCGGNDPIRTYHAWIADSQLLISASSHGSRDFGELLFAALNP